MKTILLCAFATCLIIGCASRQTSMLPPPIPPPAAVPESKVDKHPEVVITNMEPLNTSDDDFAANIGASGHLLYFTSTRSSGKGGQDLFVALKAGSAWTSISPMESLNTSDNEGSSTISPDGQTMVFAAIDRSGGKGDADLYTSSLKNGAWTEPTNMTDINTDDWESQPSLSPDGNTLYFVSNRPGGQGGSDVWQSTRQGNGTWGTPENLGSTVNTPFDEMSPSIAQDGTTLYFASNGHPSIGGFDIFVSRKKGSTWSKPRNLGTPVNSTSNENFYSAQIGTKNATFTSDRSGGKGGMDIYSAVPNPELPNPTTVVTGVVSDFASHAPLGARITISDLKTGKKTSSFRSDDQTGEYAVVLNAGHSYAITAESPNHLFYSDRFDVPAQMDNDRQIAQNIELQPVGGSVRLLVYFDFNKTDLTDESTSELDRVLAMMTDSMEMRIDLAGHTDNVGKKDYNDQLSLNRANAVKTWLVAHGIAEPRITTHGYGMMRPVALNDTEEGRAKNRRVEFHIL